MLVPDGLRGEGSAAPTPHCPQPLVSADQLYQECDGRGQEVRKMFVLKSPLAMNFFPVISGAAGEGPSQSAGPMARCCYQMKAPHFCPHTNPDLIQGLNLLWPLSKVPWLSSAEIAQLQPCMANGTQHVGLQSIHRTLKPKCGPSEEPTTV